MAKVKPQEVVDAEYEVVTPTSLPAVRRPPTLQPSPDSPPVDWPTNYDLTTREGKAGLINASNVPDWIPSDGDVCRMMMTHYVVMPDEYTDRETGEVVSCCSVILIGKCGKTCRFKNHWTARRLHAVLKMYSPEEWMDGIEIECFSDRSRQQGRTYGSFRVIA